MTSQPTRPSFRRRVRGIADLLSGISECAAAAESGRRPSRRALTALGIDADAYYGIGKR